MQEKFPNPSQDRFRFLPATNKEASERLDKFRKGIRAFQEKHPEVLGATLFGSMARGEKAHTKSDIDANMYIDAENLPDERKIDEKRSEDEVAEKYLEEFLKDLGVQKGDGNFTKYYKHLHPELISTALVEEELNFLVTDLKKNKKKYREMYERFEKNFGEKSEAEKDTELLKLDIRTSTLVSPLFHAKIGSGIEKYRKIALEKIYNMSDRNTAEQIWRNIYLNILFREQGREEVVKINIPKTLEEAIRVYHKDLYEKIKSAEAAKS